MEIRPWDEGRLGWKSYLRTPIRPFFLGGSISAISSSSSSGSSCGNNKRTRGENSERDQRTTTFFERLPLAGVFFDT